jgi:alcohol dehydrogenase
MVMGHEAAGVVRDVGSGVKDLKPDDHVVFSFVPCCGGCSMCAVGRAPLCEPAYEAAITGQLLNGGRRFSVHGGEVINHHQGVSGYSEYTVAAPESLIKIEKSYPIEMAALFGCAIMTGVGAVVPCCTVAVFTTAPTPVIIAQPNNAAISIGYDFSILISDSGAATVYSE